MTSDVLFFFVLQVVVNALIQAIPSICNVLIVCLVFWLIFSIMGVQLFGGQYFKCVGSDGKRLSRDFVKTKNECISQADAMNWSWDNSKINFDNAFIAYLSLFQVVSSPMYLIVYI